MLNQPALAYQKLLKTRDLLDVEVLLEKMRRNSNSIG